MVAMAEADSTRRVIRAPFRRCLVVTQRRHIADTSLQTKSGTAAQWMEIAEAFAGPTGEGRRPGQFSKGWADRHRERTIEGSTFEEG